VLYKPRGTTGENRTMVIFSGHRKAPLLNEEVHHHRMNVGQAAVDCSFSSSIVLTFFIVVSKIASSISYRACEPRL